MSPSADQGGQTRDCAHRITTTAYALHAVVHANGSWLATLQAATVILGQCTHLLRANATDLSSALGCPLQRVRAQGVPAQRVLGDVVVVQPVMGDQLVHQRQRQRCVGARTQRDVFVAFVGRFAFARVDADELGTVALGHLGIAPKVQVAGNRIAAPNDDEFGFCKKLHPHADLATQGVRNPLGTRSGTNGAVQQRGSQLVEEARRHALGLHQAHGSGIAIRHDRLGSVRRLGCNGGQFLRNIGQGRLPAHRLKLPGPLRPSAFEGVQDALWVVRALGVARNLGAQRPVGVRVGWVTLHFESDPVLHGCDKRAGIRAVVGAGAQNGM